MYDTEARLARIRGAVEARTHNARTIAALTSNPGCSRRAVLDAAGVDKTRLAAHVGYPARFGQSQFAITRGNMFEAQVKAGGCAELLRLLRERLGLTIPEVSYDDLETVGANPSPALRHRRTRRLIARAAASTSDAGTLFDHPMLRLTIGGRPAYLEPDLVAFQLRGQFHVIEVKSFAVIDGQADGDKVAAAAVQSAVYVLALRELLTDLGHDADRVAHNVILVCPEDFSNRPTATFIDVRKQLTVLERQLRRLARIDALLDQVSFDVSFDLAERLDGTPTRPAADLRDAIGQVPAAYAPECLASCEMAYLCRAEADGRTATLGRDVHDDLGGTDTAAVAVGLATGQLLPADDQKEIATVLRMAERLRQECLEGVA